MKLFILIIGIAIGAAAVWFFRPSPGDTRYRTDTQVESTTPSTSDTFKDKLRSLNLDTDKIQEELANTGRVIRQNANKAGQAISDATADTRITAAIKTDLLRDPDLSAWGISVNTTEGTVTLSGTVANPDQIGKAMLLAMETEGVKQVISTLQVKPRD
jgi:hyperosmotically inducible protein